MRVLKKRCVFYMLTTLIFAVSYVYNIACKKHMFLHKSKQITRIFNIYKNKFNLWEW